MSNLHKPVFHGDNHPYTASIPQRDICGEPLCLVLPYTHFKSSPQGWRDFLPSDYDAQASLMTLQFFAQVFQNQQMGTPNPDKAPSFYVFKPTEDGSFYVPKFYVFCELLVRTLTNSRGDHLSKEELTLHENVVGIRIWVHILDEQYNVADAFQDLIRNNLRLIDPVQHDILYANRTENQTEEVETTSFLAVTTEENDDEMPVVPAAPAAPAAPQRRTRKQQQPKKFFKDYEMYIRISALCNYGTIIADSYVDRNEQDETLCNRNENNYQLEHPGFRLSDGGDYTNPARVFSQSRGFELSADLGACPEQCHANNYNVNTNVDEDGVWRFPAPTLVWRYDPKQFSSSVLMSERFPWTISRFDTMFKRYVNEHNLQQVHLGRRADYMLDNAIQERKQHKFASIGLVIGVAKQKEHMQDMRVEDDMRRVTIAMTRRYKQLEQIANYDDAEYRILVRIFFEDALQEFQSIFDVSANISQPLKAALIWVEEEKWAHFCIERSTIDLEIGRYGHMVAHDLFMFDAYFLIASVHRTQQEVFYARYDALRDKKGLHYCILQAGGPGSSKSVTTDNLEIGMIPGTVQRSDGMSAKAMTGNEPDNDVVRVFDETPQMFVASEKKMNLAEKGSANMYKSALTSQETSYEYMAIGEDPETGKSYRKKRKTHAEHCHVIIAHTNDISDKADAAMGTRFRNIPAMPRERPFKNIVSLVSAKFNTHEQSNKQYMLDFYRKQHWGNMLAWKMIQTRVLPEPNIEIGNYLALLMLDFLNRNAFSVYTKVRSFERIQILSQLETVAYAVDVIFNSEISPLVIQDPNTGEWKAKDFEYRDMLHIAPLLCQREDGAIKVITQLVDEYISSREYSILEWIVRKKAGYDVKKAPEDQDEDQVKWRLAQVEEGRNMNNHVVRRFLRDENYVCIPGMNIEDLAKFVSRYTQEFRISVDVVLNMLRGFSRRTIITQNYIDPYAPQGTDSHVERPQPRQKTISALEEVIGATKTEKAVYISVELIRHDPEELVRRMVKESVEHVYTRPRKVLLGITYKDNPYLFQTIQLEKRPDHVLSKPNPTYVDTAMESALFSQTRTDEKAAFTLDKERQTLTTSIDGDIERVFFTKHFKECGLEPNEWENWFPARIDERIREARGYYDPSRDADSINIPHSLGTDHRVPGQERYREMEESMIYPEDYLTTAAENTKVLKQKFTDDPNRVNTHESTPLMHDDMSSPTGEEYGLLD